MTFTPQTIDPTLDLVLEREVDVPPSSCGGPGPRRSC